MGELEILAKLIAGGGSVAQVATFAWLWVIHREQARDREQRARECRQQEKRVEAIERFIWPERLGLRCNDHHNA